MPGRRRPGADATLRAGGLGFGVSYAIVLAGTLGLSLLPGPPLAVVAGVGELLR